MEVVRGVTSSDHNAVTFNVRTGGGRKGLTAGTVEVVDSCDRLDEVVDLYTECVKHACDTAIPRKRSMRRPKLPWWSPELEGLKRDANTKKRRIRNAAPSRRRYVVEEYVRAKEVYERAAADAQTTSWKRFCTAQDRERMGWYLQGHQEHWEKPGGCFTYQRLGADVQPERVCRPPGEYLFPDDRVDTDGPYHTELRRRTDGSIRPPEASDILSEMDPPSLGLK
ncbi:hypothetical protein EVAR_48137_1 [Eumeta japonica]|uniref:Retrovirus-related Pol polyprotein from type-1 retrotransposable element R1 n=1 Tax=Eumeta variegata TaxID=151549 RepID=A0A4C2AB83_EUMVA|nr:hypothetical protein EVAR_48137_1 [Eumeta japonica]